MNMMKLKQEQKPCRLRSVIRDARGGSFKNLLSISKKHFGVNRAMPGFVFYLSTDR